MTTTRVSSSSTSVIRKPRFLWLQRIIALVALLNVVLVFFDLSYVYLRDFYLQMAPAIVEQYDPVKGIRPHPETEYYLDRIDALQAQVVATGLSSPEATDALTEVRQLSLQLIQDNPFAVAGKSSTLAKIKDDIRQRTGENVTRKAFATFWSQPYLAEAGWQSEIAFWNQQVRPRIQTNYLRDIGRFGHSIDRFWQLDLPFVGLFGLDFLLRTWQISRTQVQLSWLEAMLRRWYDLFLLLPLGRWLRVIPVSIRLYETDLANLDPVRSQINHNLAIGFAQELTEIIGIQVIEQLQDAVASGDLARWLFYPQLRHQYVQVNQTDEVTAIASRLVTVSVYDVLPKVQPDIEALLTHSITSTLNRSVLYQQLQRFPGLDKLPLQLTEKLAKDVSQAAYTQLVQILEDPAGIEIVKRLSQNFRDAFEQELQKTYNAQEIQSLLVDLLEEIKLNYVKRIAQTEIEKLVEKTEQLRYTVRVP